DDMKSRLTAMFADWNAKQAPVPPFPQVQKAGGAGVYLAEKTDVTQTFFEVGHLGGLASDKDFSALEVATDILGGGFSSRLFRRIRTELGYVYDVSAYWGAQFDHPGLFEINGSTQSKYTVATLAAVRDELAKIRSAEVTPEELQVAKDKVLNSFVFRFDRPSKTLNRLMLYKYYGYPEDFVFRYQKAVESVTRADVLRVAQKYFNPDQLTIVTVGNPAEFGEPLSKLGLPVQKIDLTIPEPPRPPAAAVTAKTAEQGRALLIEMQKAMGGPDKLAAIKSTRMQSSATMNAGGQEVKVSEVSLFVAPSSLRQELTLPFGTMVVYSNGQTGWMATPQGVQEAPPPMLKQARGELFRELFTLALSDRDPNRTISLAGPNTLNIADKEGDSVELRMDPATHLPAALVYSEVGQAGPVNSEEDYSDWREVSGVKAPFHIKVSHDGKPFADAVVEDCKINPPLSADELAQKPAPKKP